MTGSRVYDKPAFYRIVVKGVLDPMWSDWFDDLEVIYQEQGKTTLTGPVPDQAALHGILAKISNLNLPLLSVERLDNPVE